MVTKLIIARHGNTFDKGDVVLRVGVGTDLPLSSSGREQGVLMGKYFLKENLRPDVVFSSELKRTKETAEIALETAGLPKKVEPLAIFNEIDYGPDEGKPEEEVVARVGEEALTLWDEKGIVPDGWRFDPEACIRMWRDFAAEIEKKYKGRTVLVVTSNGVARFCPYLTGDFEKFSRENKIKISTGALCFLSKEDGEANWVVDAWNVRPRDFV